SSSALSTLPSSPPRRPADLGVIGCCGHDLMVSRDVWQPAPAPLRPGCSEGAGCAPPRTTYPGSMSVDHTETLPEGARPVSAPDAPALRIRRSPAVPMPHRAHPDDAGLDLKIGRAHV